MPYEWQSDRPEETRLHLWPHRSLTQRGFVWFIAVNAALIALPVLALAAIWFALRRNQRDTEIIEDLILTPERIVLQRHGPHGQRKEWQANPHWVRITLHRRGGPVPNYLTLRGDGREVEIGAFLSEDERIALRADLAAALSRLR